MSEFFPELSPPYSTIVADPPWEIPSAMGAGGRRARKTTVPYSFMEVTAIESLPVSDLAADDAFLFLWVTPRYHRLGIGVRVASEWGFAPRSEIVWAKPNLGMGSFPRTSHEIVLICSRGDNARYTDVPRDIHSVQHWPQVYATNGGKTHSAKPAAFFDLVERVSPGPYVELFARQPRLGWDSWGYGYEGAA